MISVIIPCYNYGHLIVETIESILQQTYTDLEIIVINDGSTDNTEEIVKDCMRKDKRIFYFGYSNSGLGSSRNRGLEKVNGEYIQFLDADDLIEKNKFEVQINLFSRHTEADLVYGSVRYFKKNPYDVNDRLLTYWGKNEEWMHRLSGKGLELLRPSLSITPAHLSSVLFRKSIVDKIGLFDNEISAVADYDFLLRCCVADAYFLYHDTPGAYSLVRWHPENMSKNISLMLTHEIQMRRKLNESLPNKELKEVNQMAIKSHELRISKSWKSVFLSGGKFDTFKKYLRMLGLDRFFRRIFYKNTNEDTV